MSEQFNEGVYYWTRFDCKGKVKLNVATSFDLKDVKVIADKDIEWSVKDNVLEIKAKGPFKAVVEPKGYIKPLLAAGSLKNVVFKNISVVGDQSSFSGDIYLKGRSESESIGTITFENVNFFGQPVNDSPKHTLFVGEHAAEPIFR